MFGSKLLPYTRDAYSTMNSLRFLALVLLSHLYAIDARVKGYSRSKGEKAQPKRRLGASKGEPKAKQVITFWQPDGDIFVSSNPPSATLFATGTATVDQPGLVAILDKPIYAEDKTTVIGKIGGTCTRIVAGESWYCSGGYEFLDKGEIESGTSYPSPNTVSVSGPFYDGIDIWNSITGGTGVYESATGQGYYVVEGGGWNHVTLYIN